MVSVNTPRLPEPTTVFDPAEKQYLHELLRVLRVSLDDLARNAGSGTDNGGSNVPNNIDGGHADTVYGGMDPIDGGEA